METIELFFHRSQIVEITRGQLFDQGDGVGIQSRTVIQTFLDVLEERGRGESEVGWSLTINCSNRCWSSREVDDWKSFSPCSKLLWRWRRFSLISLLSPTLILCLSNVSRIFRVRRSNRSWTGRRSSSTRSDRWTKFRFDSHQVLLQFLEEVEDRWNLFEGESWRSGELLFDLI